MVQHWNKTLTLGWNDQYRTHTEAEKSHLNRENIGRRFPYMAPFNLKYIYCICIINNNNTDKQNEEHLGVNQDGEISGSCETFPQGEV